MAHKRFARGGFARVQAAFLAAVLVLASWGPAVSAALAAEEASSASEPASSILLGSQALDGENLAPGQELVPPSETFQGDSLEGISAPEASDSQNSANPSESFNFGKTPVHQDNKVQLLMAGYRFDKATGQILSPKTKQPISRADFARLQAEKQKGRFNAALWRLWQLANFPDQADPRKSEEHIQSIFKAQWDILPKELLASHKVGPEAFKQSIFDHLAERTLPKNASLTFAAPAQSAPPPLKAAAAAPASNYFDERESRLGAAIQAEVVRQFERNPRGADLVNALKHGQAAPQLPEFVVLDVDSRFGGFYAHDYKLIVLHQGDLLESVLSHVPAQDRGAVKTQIETEASLADYMLAHPKAIEDFVRDNDSNLFHELVHHVQDLRGSHAFNIFNGLLSNEYEAYFHEGLFFHGKLSDDAEAVSHGWAFRYWKLIKQDFGSWKADIDRYYQSNWSSTSKTIKGALQSQKGQSLFLKTVEAAWPDVLDDWIATKRLAVARAFRLLRARKRQDSAMLAKFEKAHPRLRREGLPRWASAWEKKGRWDKALYAWRAFIKILPEGKEKQDAIQAAYKAAVKALLWMPAQKLELADRLDLINAVQDAYDQAGRPYHIEFWQGRKAIYSEQAAHLRSLAKMEPARAARHLLDAASFEKALADDRTIVRSYAESNLTQAKRLRGGKEKRDLLDLARMQAEVADDAKLLAEIRREAGEGPSK